MGQGGNVSEWMESAFDGTNSVASAERAARGGSYQSFYYPGVTTSPLISSARGIGVPSNEIRNLGFRVASVPEPSPAVLVLMAGGAWLLRKRLSRSLPADGSCLLAGAVTSLDTARAASALPSQS